MRTIRLVCGAWVLGSASLFAFDITAVGVLDICSPTVSDTTGAAVSTDKKIGIGFGALVSVYSTTAFTLEAGLISLSRQYALSASPAETIGLKMLEVPILLRFDLLPIVSVSAGAYLALGMGDISKSNPTSSTTETYNANSLGKTDYGLQASASLTLPILPTMKFLIDLRYLYGIANLDTRAGASFKFSDIQLLGGIRISI